MPQYTIHLVSKGSGRLSRCYTFTAPDDGAAEEFVRQRQTDEVVELWQGGRKVARFDPANDGSGSSIWL